LRLTYKRLGKTFTEALPNPAAVRKAEQEIAEFRNYQQLSRDLVDVSEQVCRLRPVEEAAARPVVWIWRPLRWWCARPCTTPEP
jgi:hypothetical protein